MASDFQCQEHYADRRHARLSWRRGLDTSKTAAMSWCWYCGVEAGRVAHEVARALWVPDAVIDDVAREEEAELDDPLTWIQRSSDRWHRDLVPGGFSRT